MDAHWHLVVESGIQKSATCTFIICYCNKCFVLQVNCLLEAFGHAKTPRNNNSSRFIKLLTIQYCDKRSTPLRGSTRFCHYSSIWSLFTGFHLDLNLCVLFQMRGDKKIQISINTSSKLSKQYHTLFSYNSNLIEYLLRYFYQIYSCALLFASKVSEKLKLLSQLLL